MRRKPFFVKWVFRRRFGSWREAQQPLYLHVENGNVNGDSSVMVFRTANFGLWHKSVRIRLYQSFGDEARRKRLWG